MSTIIGCVPDGSSYKDVVEEENTQLIDGLKSKISSLKTVRGRLPSPDLGFYVFHFFTSGVTYLMVQVLALQVSVTIYCILLRCKRFSLLLAKVVGIFFRKAVWLLVFMDLGSYRMPARF